MSRRPNSRWAVAADKLLAEHRVKVRRYRTTMTGIAFHHRPNEIEAPEPRGPISFAILAHEVGHVALAHVGKGCRRRAPRWQHEVEAWDFALAQFDRFGLPGRDRVIPRATVSIGWAFTKAVRRGVSPTLIDDTYPLWSERVVDLEPF